MLLIFCVFFIINKENIEQKILSSISSKITSTLNSNVQISNIDFKYNGEIILNNLNILDHKNDTLIFIEKIRTSILNSTNILTSKTKLNSLQVSNGKIKLNKYKGDSILNLQVFLNKTYPKSDNPLKEFEFNLKSFFLDNFTISFYNESNIVNELKPKGDSYKHLLYVNQLVATSLYRKSLWKAVGGYDESMKKGFEDWKRIF